MNGRRLLEPIVILAVAGATELLVFASGVGPARTVFGLVFALLVPGWAVLRLVRLASDPLTWMAFAVAISTAMDIAVVLPLFYLGIWSIQLAVTLLVGIIVVLFAIDLSVTRRWLGGLAAETIVALNRWRIQ
jgi:RsiW-degrading membrane proteinase PrsW (M82 family)